MTLGGLLATGFAAMPPALQAVSAFLVVNESTVGGALCFRGVGFCVWSEHKARCDLIRFVTCSKSSHRASVQQGCLGSPPV